MKASTTCNQIIGQLLTEAKATQRKLYAIIDSAVHQKIHHLIKRNIAKESYSNLFHHTDFSEIEDAAPYLVHLTKANAILLNKIWRYPWGIFLITSVERDEIEAHLRTNLFAEDPLGEELLFRYYDPRVLPVFLNNSSDEERQLFFGPIEEMYALTTQNTQLKRYSAYEWDTAE
ncbi:hypothetical protein MNBD_GAMMA12-2203 [hydrothermal vent metagenome]|uniref:DUF4123 domain-containing protein n=1 Tax=hydrothermal vent metagenome TaxID=652676 RepID=A0A3B0YQT8_9ZZZZ